MGFIFLISLLLFFSFFFFLIFLEIQALWTPGHTPDSITYYIKYLSSTSPSKRKRKKKKKKKKKKGKRKRKEKKKKNHTHFYLLLTRDDCLFAGDTLFMPDSGSARCDFPNGSAKKLWDSAQRMLSLPDDVKFYVCHDYQPGFFFFLFFFCPRGLWFRKRVLIFFFQEEES